MDKKKLKSKNLEGRIVKVKGDEINVYDIKNPKRWYSAVYQNKDTKELDERFGLTGDSVKKGSEIEKYLNLSTAHCSLGKTEVEYLLRYFAHLAKQAGNFVGILEKELREHLRKGDLGQAYGEGYINLALEYKDYMRKGATYLKRIKVERKNILFPCNLKKMLI